MPSLAYSPRSKPIYPPLVNHRIYKSVSHPHTTSPPATPPPTAQQTNTVPGAPVPRAHPPTHVSAPPAAATTSARQDTATTTGAVTTLGRRSALLGREARGRAGIRAWGVCPRGMNVGRRRREMKLCVLRYRRRRLPRRGGRLRLVESGGVGAEMYISYALWCDCMVDQTVQIYFCIL
jgi:hypothetical protein